MEKQYIINESDLVTLLKDNIVTQLFYDSSLISDGIKDKVIDLLMTEVEVLYRDTLEGEDFVPEIDADIMLNRIVVEKMRKYNLVKD